MSRTFSTVKPGDALPSVTGVVTQQTINDYADMSGDYNPIHVDPEHARSTPYASTIAHGPIPLDFAVQMMKRWLGVAWPRGATVKGKFIAAVKPGDQITAHGTVVRVGGSGPRRVTCEFSCENQRGERVIVGELDCPLDD